MFLYNFVKEECPCNCYEWTENILHTQGARSAKVPTHCSFPVLSIKSPIIIDSNLSKHHICAADSIRII